MKPVVEVRVEREDAALPTSQNFPKDDRLVVKWLESQSGLIQTQLARERLDYLLDKAAQPRHASGDTCIKLCYFAEQCRDSKATDLQQVVFSEKTALDLFNFYIELNEKNQHRSMRRILELLSSLLSINPDGKTSDPVKLSMLQRLLSIITHQSAQPLVKPAFKSLEYFLGKGAISTGALIDCYEDQTSSNESDPGIRNGTSSSWDSLMTAIFEWLAVPDVSPAAGKLLVTLFIRLRDESAALYSQNADHTVLWQRWIRNGLHKNPDILENVKNYLFPALFKLDRTGSLLFLHDLNNQGSISNLQVQDSSAHFLLQLAALEVGKKLGLVEDPGAGPLHIDLKNSTKPVVLEEAAIGDLLNHASDTVRSLAFSVIVSSASPIRPFSALALNILHTHIAVLFADTDAKFRNEVLSNSRHMIERLRGATAYLTRELDRNTFLFSLDYSARRVPQKGTSNPLDHISALLAVHEKFVQWYIEFLSGEMIPTASYQRHITALKATTSLLRSGILETESAVPSLKTSDNATIWPFSIHFFIPRTMRLIMDLLMDPFEDVRANATVVLKLASRYDFSLENFSESSKDASAKFLQLDAALKKIPTRHQPKLQQFAKSTSVSNADHGSTKPQVLLDFIDRAQVIAKRTGRADYGDGVARSYEILYGLSSCIEDRLTLIESLVSQLELKVEVAEKNLAVAVLEAPVHSSFAALNFVWDSVDHSAAFEAVASKKAGNTKPWDSLQLRILESCKRIWNAVRDVLCNDSPEGHLPLDIDEVDNIDTKDVLSYSFRAIYESSNLMRNLVTKIKSSWRDGSAVLPAEVFFGIGELTFEQLSTLRHRGAFSTVSLTFARCCQLTQYQTANTSSHHSLLEQWYQGALQCISEQASTTRRSAGIPALITGILSSMALKPAFEDVMGELKVLVRKPVKQTKFDETNLPQVHAMNCLKEIFRSSILRKRSESHIAECLRIAADSLNSDIWAIRNCGLILLRSLIDALFGTNESKAITEAGWDGRSIKLSYDKYPALPELLLKLLDADGSTLENPTATHISSVESVFPALDIIRRAGPPSTRRSDIYNSVSVHLANKVWHVREIAARTICTLLLHDDWLPSATKLIETSTESTNRLHGVLMAVKFVLERRLALDMETATDGLEQLSTLFHSSQMWGFFESGCPEILAAYLEVVNIIARILLSARHSSHAASRSSYMTLLMDQFFAHDSFEEFTAIMQTYPIFIALEIGSPCSENTALACNAVVRRSIFTAALREDTLGLQNVISFVTALHTDITIAALESVPDAWAYVTSVDSLFGLIKAYMSAIKKTKSSEVRAVAVFNLAGVLDQIFGRVESTNVERGQNSDPARLTQHPSLNLLEMVRGEIKDLETLLQDGARTPSLSNAEIRITGSVLVCEYVFQKHSNRALNTCKPRMEAWGKLLVAAGNSNNDFESRHAAAAALSSFYHNPYFDGYIHSNEYVLPSIFALYDTLNDDDDDIRILSAETVSVLLRKSLVPLAARVELAGYISKIHSGSRYFTWNVVCRMTGSRVETVDNIRFRLQSAAAQLSMAMEEDDSLFVEEEQNLFIDEVREAKLWSKVFEGAALDTWHWEVADIDTDNAALQPHAVLAAWVLEGLLALNALLVREDGPLGWTSKSTVFALATRLLVSAKAIIQRHKRIVTSASGRSVPENRIVGGIVFALEQFITLGKDKMVHESLLLEVQGNLSLPLAILQ